MLERRHHIAIKIMKEKKKTREKNNIPLREKQNIRNTTSHNKKSLRKITN